MPPGENPEPSPLTRVKNPTASMRVAILIQTLMLLCSSGEAARPGSSVEYLGGTLISLSPRTMGWLITTDPESLVFSSRTSMLRVPYGRINQLEYGQKVNRRVWEAILLSPLFVLLKKRDHYVTVGFELEDGQQQALLFRVEKDDVRGLLVSLEARTGRKIGYQDDEARKAGK